MRRLTLVTYDIADSKRLRLIFTLMKGYGDHVQYSVFRCELSAREKIELIAELTEIINHREDQVMLLDIGVVGPRTNEKFTILGKPGVPVKRKSVII